MNLITLTTGTSTTATGAGGFFGSTWGMVIIIVGMFALMYFMMIRPQSKQKKAEEELRKGTEIGDEIVTIGGICGKVVSVKDDAIVIETGADRNKMKITRWAIQTNITKQAAQQEAMEAAKKAKAEEKAAAKKAKETPAKKDDKKSK